MLSEWMLSSGSVDANIHIHFMDSKNGVLWLDKKNDGRHFVIHQHARDLFHSQPTSTFNRSMSIVYP